MRHEAACALAFSLAATAARAQAAGPEFQVNGSVTGEQGMPAVAALRSGNLLVAWTQLQAGASPVFARVLDGAGAPLGPEFRVSATASRMFLPSLAATPGGFVLVWEDHASATVAVRGRRFDASGNGLGAEFTVSGGEPSVDEAPRVAAAADGGFVVVWTSIFAADGSGLGVFGRRFSPSAVPLGPPFQVNTYTTGDQGGLFPPPSLAVAGDGSFAVVWESFGQDGSGAGVYGQLFDAAGARRGAEFRVNASTSGSQAGPTVAFDAGGGLRVAWSGPDAGGAARILARRIDSSGSPVGDELRVSAASDGYDAAASLVAVAGGRHVVVWERQAIGGGLGSLRARTLDAGGVPVGEELQVSAYVLAQTPLSPTTAAASDGAEGFVAGWSALGPPPLGNGIFARRFTAEAPAPAAADASGGTHPDGSAARASRWP